MSPMEKWIIKEAQARLRTEKLLDFLNSPPTYLRRVRYGWYDDRLKYLIRECAAEARRSPRARLPQE